MLEPTKTPIQDWEKPIEQSLQPPNTQPIKKWSYGLIGAGALLTLAAALLYRKGLYPLLGRVTLVAAPTALITGFSLAKRADKQQGQWRERTQDILSPNGQSLKKIREQAPHASPEQLAFAIREDLLSEKLKYSEIIEKHSALELSKLFEAKLSEEECNPQYREALKAKFLQELKETASLTPFNNPTGQLLSSFPNLKVTTDEYLTAFKSGLSEEEEVCDDKCFYGTAEQAIAKHHLDSLLYLMSINKVKFDKDLFLKAAEEGDTLLLEYLFNNPPLSFHPNWPQLFNQCLNKCQHLPTIEMLMRLVERDGCAIIESRTTPDLLHKVAASGDSEASGLITQLLKYAYVDPNASRDNKRPLWVAIEAENARSIEALVTHPTHCADPNFQDSVQLVTPLQKAVEMDSKEMVAALLKAKNLKGKEEAYAEAVKQGKSKAASAFFGG